MTLSDKPKPTSLSLTLLEQSYSGATTPSSLSPATTSANATTDRSPTSLDSGRSSSSLSPAATSTTAGTDRSPTSLDSSRSSSSLSSHFTLSSSTDSLANTSTTNDEPTTHGKKRPI